MNSVLKFKAIDRLNFYGINPAKLSNKDLFTINELVVTYVTTHNIKTFNSVKRSLLLHVVTHKLTINSARLDAVRLQTVGLLVKEEKETKPFNPNDFEPLNVNRVSSTDRNKVLANKYQERKSLLVVKPSLESNVLCECVTCGEIATTEKERIHFFNRRTTGEFKSICKGCE